MATLLNLNDFERAVNIMAKADDGSGLAPVESLHLSNDNNTIIIHVDGAAFSCGQGDYCCGGNLLDSSVQLSLDEFSVPEPVFSSETCSMTGQAAGGAQAKTVTKFLSVPLNSPTQTSNNLSS